MRNTAILFIATLMSLNSCVKHGHEAETDEHHHNNDGITMTVTQMKNAGVKTETMSKGVFHGVIKTSGRVISASCDETTVAAPTNGRVSLSDHISEGMHIAAGKTVMSITTSGFISAEGDPVKRASIEYEKAKQNYERAQLLVKDKIISNKDFQLVKAEYETALLTYRGISQSRSKGGVNVNTPKAGYVKQLLVSGGDYVEAGQPLMIITQNQHLYLRVEVPERHWNELSRIRGAKFSTSYSDQLYDISTMGGRIQSYGRSAESGSAFIPIIFEFNNTGNIVQGSFAEIYLITDERQGVLTVPVTALTEEQGIHYVYIQEHADEEDAEFRKQEVTLGMSDGSRCEILKGIKEGDKVVTHGAVQVRLASASNAIPAHTHNH